MNVLGNGRTSILFGSLLIPHIHEHPVKSLRLSDALRTGFASCSNAIMLKVKQLYEINAKTIEDSVFWMKHSKHHLKLRFLRLLLMAVFGQVRRWLRGYPRHSSVLSVMCQVGNISNVSVGLDKHLVHNIRQLQHQMRSKHLKKT